MRLPSRLLVDMGHRYAEITDRPDSALVCFTLVASRYDEKATREEQRLATVAYMGKWYLYFFKYFDYAKAFENLSKARDISVRIGCEEARVLMDFGCMYQTIAEQNDSRKLNKKAYGYYREAFQKGLEQSDTLSTFLAFANLVTVAFSLDSLQSIESDYALFNKHKCDNRIAYCGQLYQGLMNYSRGNYKKALAIFQRQYAMTKGREGYERLCHASCFNMVRSLIGMQHYGQAIDKLRLLEQQSTALNMKDAKLEVYRTLADCYQKIGEGQASLLYHNKYFSLKDTLMNYQQVASVNELHFLNEMKQLDEQLSQLSREKHIQNVAMAVLLGVAIMFGMFFLVIFKKNKLLRKKNQMLYQRSQEEIGRHAPPSTPQRKYQNSTLGNEEKDAIMQRVLHVIDSSSEIYSADFTIERLAQLVESKSKYVSQAINEKYNDNFNSLVNKYRIRESCRRLSDSEHYGQYTIDAIGKSVGFRSRSTFVMAFRRFTGLTPSEYQRIAKNGTD